jgi:hypothetical protein
MYYQCEGHLVRRRKLHRGIQQLLVPENRKEKLVARNGMAKFSLCECEKHDWQAHIGMPLFCRWITDFASRRGGVHP